MSDTPTPRCSRCFGTGYIPSETCMDCVDCQDICPVCKNQPAPSAPPASAPKENHEEAAQVSDERSVERSELSRLRARGVGENPPSNKAASARTVTRYRLEFDVGAVREVGIHAGVSLAKGTHVVLYAEVAALLTAWADLESDKRLLDLITRSKSPCGHWGSHAYSPDGKGKQILCLDCENTKLRATLAEAEAEIARLQQPRQEPV